LFGNIKEELCYVGFGWEGFETGGEEPGN